MTEERISRLSSIGQLGLWGGISLSLVLLFLPPLGDLSRPAQNLAAVSVLMATLWITQTLPIAVTALIPLPAFPLLGIQPSDVVSKAYIDQNVFLFLGGFIIALGIEKWGLHQRMALHIVRFLGTSPRRMVLGFMLATAFLSMWISNTAATLLMLPIGLALLTSLNNLPLKAVAPSELENLEKQRDSSLSQLMAVLLLGIAYSASIGGFTTLVGTPTNVTFLTIWQQNFPEGPEISAGQWGMMAVTPLGVLYLFLAWGCLTWRLPAIPGADQLDRGFFTNRLRQLGPLRGAEWLMLSVFISTALLWLFRKPLTFGETVLMPGWEDWRALDWIGAKGLHDSTVAMGMAVLMFIIPARRNVDGQTEFLMDWKTAERLPWGILLLFGGGFALAGAFQSTGLSLFLGQKFSTLVAHWPAWLLVAATCFLLTFLTELTSNVATVATLVPVLAQAAVEIGLDPRLVMIPATLAASCAFMLPIATPPNAIIFGSNRVQMGQMVRYGIALNLAGIVLITAAMFLLIVPQLGISLDAIPDWAARPASSP
jgi:solute carrier family 13 (sodium-dependent dicarboxylate transporter), member 2/3/5